MDVMDAMRTNGACREFLPDPVPPEVILRAMDAARFGPTGGNRQGTRFVAVFDEEKRRKLGDWFRVPTLRNLAEVRRHREGGTAAGAMRIGEGAELMFRRSENFAHHFHETPVIIVACVGLDSVLFTDEHLDRTSIVGGASVYPLVQNLVLALRSQGVASCMTTILCESEPQVKELLGIPDNYATACHIAAGYPLRKFPKSLRRAPLADYIYRDAFGDQFDEDDLRLASPAAEVAK